MKTSPLTTPHAMSRLSEHAFLRPLWSTGPGVGAAASWLSCNGIDPGSVLAAITQRLKDRGRLLPKDKLVAYHRRVLFDEFIAHWVKKNKRSSIRDWFENGEVKDEAKVKAEFEPFEAVVLDLCTAAAFEREVRKLVNVAEAQRTGTSFGDGLSFEGFCHLSSWTLANRLLANFEPDRRARNGSSVRYLLKTATGCFLNRCNGQKDYASAGMIGYLADSKVRWRNAVAYKLAYCPLRLTYDEKAWLRRVHGLEPTGRRWKIKEIAQRLGYASAGALSRKFYRMRKWRENGLTRLQDNEAECAF